MKLIYEFISAEELVIIQDFGLHSGIESMEGMGQRKRQQPMCVNV